MMDQLWLFPPPSEIAPIAPAQEDVEPSVYLDEAMAVWSDSDALSAYLETLKDDLLDVQGVPSKSRHAWMDTQEHEIKSTIRAIRLRVSELQQRPLH